MRAIILAAGRGSRMSKLTEDKPKCLNVLGGKRLIDWQLEALRAAGIRKIAIAKGYLAEKLDLPETFGFLNPRWQETNMLMSLYAAREWLNEDICIISYSDIAYFSDSVALLMQSKGDIAITYDPNWLRLWSARFENPLADAETFQIDPQGFITEIGSRAKSLDEIKGQYMGLLKFTPAGWKKVEDLLAGLTPLEQDKLDMTSLLKRLLLKGVKIAAVPIQGPWYEVDSEKDLLLYNSMIEKKVGASV